MLALKWFKLIPTTPSPSHWMGWTPFDGIVWAFLSHANEAFTLAATTSYNPWTILTLANDLLFREQWVLKKRKKEKRITGLV